MRYLPSFHGLLQISQTEVSELRSVEDGNSPGIYLFQSLNPRFNLPAEGHLDIAWSAREAVDLGENVSKRSQLTQRASESPKKFEVCA